MAGVGKEGRGGKAKSRTVYPATFRGIMEFEDIDVAFGLANLSHDEKAAVS